MKIEDCKVLSEYGDAHYLYNNNKHTNTFLAVEIDSLMLTDVMRIHLFVWDNEKKSLIVVESVELGPHSDGHNEDFNMLHEVLQENYINSSHYTNNDVEITENGDFDYAGEEYYSNLSSNMA